MKYIDISRTLSADVAVWPGDTPFDLQTQLRIAEGASVNLTHIRTSAHTGTHADARRHYILDGQPLHEADLRPFWGRAQVVTVSKAAGPLTPDDFAHVDLSLAPRLLIHSSASHRPLSQFPPEYVYPSPELVDHWGQNDIILFGTDAPSVDHVDSKDLPGHEALGRNHIAIVEGLLLADVADGVYEFAALPLKIAGGDGSPVRAVLRPIGEKDE